MFRISELLFRWIRIATQPVEQLLAVRGNDVELRKMHMAIDQAGDDEIAAQIFYFSGGGEPGKYVTGRGELFNNTVPGDQDAILDVLDCRRIGMLARIGKTMQE